MTALGFTLFETPIGRCAVAWSGTGILGVQLPENRDADTRARVAQLFPHAQELAPPADIQRALDDIVALLRGESRDLSAITLDLSRVTPFHRRVYEIARAIPRGATIAYGDIAKQLGMPGSARAVGQALGRNPFPIIVPCHRVLASGGKMGGFSANGGVTTKLRLLRIEGFHTNGGPTLFDGDGMFGFEPEEALAHLRESDAKLAALIDRVGVFNMQLKKTPSIFVALTESIIYQQLHGKAAATIFARVCALFPRAHEGPTPEQILRTSDEKLRGAGLSRGKLLALRDLAARAVDGTLPTLAEVHRLDNEAIIERLTQVRGIGRWTAEMLLMFRLGRPDVLPVDDFGIRKGFGVAFGKREMPTREAVAKHGERWKPYRTVASWYLWRAAESPIDLPKPKPKSKSKSKVKSAPKTKQKSDGMTNTTTKPKVKTKARASANAKSRS
jgi:O-6-methylguanine DNA methyltransferase